MVEFEIRVHPEQRVAYIPKEIFDVLGTKLKAVPNRVAVLLYSRDTAMEDVLKSLTIIQQDLEHAVKLQKEAYRGRSPCPSRGPLKHRDQEVKSFG